MVPVPGFEPGTPRLMVGQVGIEPTQIIQLFILRPFVSPKSGALPTELHEHILEMFPFPNLVYILYHFFLKKSIKNDFASHRIEYQVANTLIRKIKPREWNNGINNIGAFLFHFS